MEYGFFYVCCLSCQFFTLGVDYFVILDVLSLLCVDLTKNQTVVD